jgi:hypothetical protein
MVNQETTIHQFQRSLFHLVDKNINVKIEEPILTASNIFGEIFQHLSFVTNDPSFQNNQYEHLIGLNIFIDNELKPIQIPGLFEIVTEYMRLSDVKSYINKERIFKPFEEGFGPNHYSIDQIVDFISELSPRFASTRGKIKKYELILDVPAFPNLAANLPPNLAANLPPNLVANIPTGFFN